MVKESRCNCLCFADGAIDLISKKWSLLVINALGNHQVLRYSELMKELNGVSPKALADILALLCKERLVQKESFPEIPPRVQYSLTNEGRQLREAIEPLLRWAITRHRSSPVRCVPKYKRVRAHILKENGIGSHSDVNICNNS